MDIRQATTASRWVHAKTAAAAEKKNISKKRASHSFQGSLKNVWKAACHKRQSTAPILLGEILI